MAPAEIFQGGKAVTVIAGKETHRDTLRGWIAIVKDNITGEGAIVELEKDKFELKPGDTVAFDSGTIVKGL